ncbi:MAG TPA: hemerythrin domain-containing protein, partial [bacterium]|nr:hemerythrin domain-containing protein [bacterium]
MANQKGGNTATSETGTGTSAARSSGTSRGSGRKAGARQGGRKNAAKGSAGTTGGTQLRGAAAGKSNDPIQLLKADHQRVNQLFTEFESAEDNQKQQLVRQICQELVIHAMLEEQLFYPACRDAIEDEELLNRAQVEHDSAKLLIGDLMSGRGDRSFRDAKVKVLAEQVRHHVQEEEQPRRGILAQAKAAGVATPELAAQMQELKQSLMERGEALPNPQPISFQPTMSNQFREVTMARNDYNDRDDRGGRYGMSEGRGGGGGGYRSAGGRDDDDRGHGRGGWFGDPEGHSEAARRGWETREEEERGGRSYGGSRGGYSEGRGGGGYSSRGYGRDDDDGRGQGRGGWFGDPEGHSEAARRGWESREDDDRGGRSYGSTRGGYGGGRGRDDDEGPGWHGDPRGHS